MLTPIEVFRYITYTGAGLGVAIIAVCLAIGIGHVILESVKDSTAKNREEKGG